MVYAVLDGPDGCGKSVQAERLCAALGREGVRTLHLREPGSTPVGEALRRLLLDPATGDLTPWSEALLFTAARAEMVARLVRPALAEGLAVVVERCFLSTLVYQGLAHDDGVPHDVLWDLSRRAHGDCMPDRIWVLDVAPEVAERRRGQRVADRIEDRGAPFHRRVRDAYLELAGRVEGCEVLDAAASLDEVQQVLQQRMAVLLARGAP